MSRDRYHTLPDQERRDDQRQRDALVPAFGGTHRANELELLGDDRLNPHEHRVLAHDVGHQTIDVDPIVATVAALAAVPAPAPVPTPTPAPAPAPVPTTVRSDQLHPNGLSQVTADPDFKQNKRFGARLGRVRQHRLQTVCLEPEARLPPSLPPQQSPQVTEQCIPDGHLVGRRQLRHVRHDAVVLLTPPIPVAR